MDCSTPGAPVLHYLPEFAQLMSLESVMSSNHLILGHPLLFLTSVFPSIRVFPVSRLFTSGGQSVGASSSVLPMNIQGWFPLGLTGWICLLSKGLLRVFSSTTVWKYQLFLLSLLYGPTFTPYMTTGKTIALTMWIFVSKVMSLLFNTLSRFVIAFLPRSKYLNFMAAVTVLSDFEAQENKVCHCLHSRERLK